MAASRTRKKAKQKKTAEQRNRQEQARINKMRQVLGPAMDAAPACRECHGERQAVEREDIPAEDWQKLEPLIPQLAAQGLAPRQFVYCPTCREYAIMGDWASF